MILRRCRRDSGGDGSCDGSGGGVAERRWRVQGDGADSGGGGGGGRCSAGEDDARGAALPAPPQQRPLRVHQQLAQRQRRNRVHGCRHRRRRVRGEVHHQPLQAGAVAVGGAGGQAGSGRVRRGTSAAAAAAAPAAPVSARRRPRSGGGRARGAVATRPSPPDGEGVSDVRARVARLVDGHTE